MEEDLKKLGLSWNEIKVYLSLVKVGETPVGGIINDLKVHRQIIYNALDELEKRNMVSKTLRNKVSHYKITDPEIIVDNIKQQELIASRVSREIGEALKTIKKEQEINVLSGQQGMRQYFINKYKGMSADSIVYVMNGYVKKFEEAFGKDFFGKKYMRIRKEKNIKSKNLATESFKEEYKDYNKGAENIREIKYLPDYMFNPISTDIWDDGVCFISLGENPFIIEIKNKEIRDAYLVQFNSLWEMAKE